MQRQFALKDLTRDAMAQLSPQRLFNLSDQVAIVTGAGGGLGAWISAGLAAAGAKVFLTDHPRSPTSGTAALLRGGGAEVHEHACDLMQDDAADSIVRAAIERFGRVDILVNNAGTNRREPIFEVSRQTWELIHAVDLRLPYELSRAVAKSIAARGGGAAPGRAGDTSAGASASPSSGSGSGSGGSIIHIGSLNNAIGLEGVSVYGAHKAALCQLAKSMSVEWARYGIRVNALCPGFMMTPLSKPLWDDRQRGGWILERSLMRRPGYPDELIGTLLLLASGAGSFITGQTLYVDGGWMAGTPWSEESYR